MIMDTGLALQFPTLADRKRMLKQTIERMVEDRTQRGVAEKGSFSFNLRFARFAQFPP
jgi:hypothetical protein